MQIEVEAAEPAGSRIWDVIVSGLKRIPAQDFAAMPRDGASQIDHYVYGVPKDVASEHAHEKSFERTTGSSNRNG